MNSQAGGSIRLGSFAPGSRSSQAMTSFSTAERFRAPYSSPSRSHRSSPTRIDRTGVCSEFGDGTALSVGPCPYTAQMMSLTWASSYPYKDSTGPGCVSIHGPDSVSIHEQAFTRREAA